jgi:GGDEF domain-containing protein
VLTSRLREEAQRSLGPVSTNLAVGHVEWQADESVAALEARVEAALASTTVRPLMRSVPQPAVEAHAAETTEVLRGDVLEAIAHAIREARPYERSLAVVALDVGVVDDVGSVAVRLSDSVGNGRVFRLGASELVLVLSGATADDAETLLGSLHPETDGGPELVLNAGITELVERDGAQTALARAEHALWQAKQTGRGTVVVAVPGRRTPRFE